MENYVEELPAHPEVHFGQHIWSESKYDNFDIPNIPKTDPDSPKRALSDRAMG